MGKSRGSLLKGLGLGDTGVKRAAPNMVDGHLVKVANNDNPCLYPFRNLYLWEDWFTLCCWSKKITRYDGRTVEDMWRGAESEEMRKAVLDGTYHTCSDTCPHLQKLVKGVDGFFNKRIPSKPNTPLINQGADKGDVIDGGLKPPTFLQSSMSYACNLECPSCRDAKITDQPRPSFNKSYTLDGIKLLGPGSSLNLGGSGEPLITKETLDVLRNSTEDLLVNVDEVSIVTNGLLLTPRMYQSFSQALKGKRLAFQVSVDASSEEVYEKRVRLGGRWSKLLDNLAFISQEFRDDPSKTLTLLFVIQDLNHMDMVGFVEIAEALGAGYSFSRILKWDKASNGVFKEKDIMDPYHPRHQSLMHQLSILEERFGYKWEEDLA